jgi:pimeloyl-ACP methyl ester carboxylesterase
MGRSLPPPGPVETAILAELHPVFSTRRFLQGAESLRILEGGSGPPLVLLHGRGSAAIGWFPLLRALARNRRVLAVDLPGFGQSSAPPFRGEGFEAGAAYFTDPIEAWMRAERLDGAAVVGHSLGGLVTVELALRRRVAIGKIALIAPMGVGAAMTLGSRLFFRAGPERLARALGKGLFGALVPSPSTADPTRLAALFYELSAVAGGRPEASAAFDALHPVLGPVPNRLSRLSEIHVPALVIWGNHDEVFPAPLGIAAAAALPRSELHIEELGHAPHTEAPDRVLPMISAFLG